MDIGEENMHMHANEKMNMVPRNFFIARPIQDSTYVCLGEYARWFLCRKKITENLTPAFFLSKIRFMIRLFTVEGFKGFSKPVTFDFRKKHEYGFSTACISGDYISKILVYGANGSGKSNLGYAIFDIVALLTDKNLSANQLDETSFLNADSDDGAASFHYEFDFSGTLITFEYKKKAPRKLLSEKMEINGEAAYFYDYEEKRFVEYNLDRWSAGSLNFVYLEPELSVLRYIVNNTQLDMNSPFKKTIDFVSRMLWFRSLQENNYIGFKTGRDFIEKWICESHKEIEFSKFLENLSGVKRELCIKKNPVTSEPVLIEKHKTRDIPFFSVASSGMNALSLFYFWSRNFGRISFLFIDEFDAFYHFDLAVAVFESVKECRNVQIVFTTHNPFLVDNEITRPDCCFMLENGSLISFPEKTDREIRLGHNLPKLLMNGEFSDQEHSVHS